MKEKLPKTFLGQLLPHGQTAKDKTIRYAFYILDSIFFALDMYVLIFCIIYIFKIRLESKAILVVMSLILGFIFCTIEAICSEKLVSKHSKK
ncbi:MAG: hypothetical protein RR922_02605 [Clostridia bacterium]